MESAPQSTSTHKAVIELASRSWCTPRRSPRARRAHKKKACPAQKGGLKSAGPCQNHTPGATSRRAETVEFGRYLRRGPMLFAEILEMAVGEARQLYRPALAVQKPWN